MALSDLYAWRDAAFAPTGTACGASDGPEKAPAACGTACGASDR